MGTLKVSELKYGTPTRISIGNYFLAATNIEFTGTNEETEGTEKGGESELILKLEKLGLPDETIAGTSEGFAALGGGGKAELGETVTGTQAPVLAWCTPLIEAKTAGEAGKNVKKYWPVVVTWTGSKLILRVFQLVAAKKTFSEATAAEKAEVLIGKMVTTVFVIGK